LYEGCSSTKVKAINENDGTTVHRYTKRTAEFSNM